MGYIILAMIFYSISIIAGAKASRGGDSNLTAAVINALSAVVPIAIIMPSVSKKLFMDNKNTILWAVVTGVLIAGFSISLTKSYQTDKIAIITPIVFGGSILASSILAYFIYDEKISSLQLLGLTLVCAGIAIIIISKSQT